MDKRMWEPRPDGDEGTSREDSWGRSIAGRGSTKYKHPEVTACPVRSRNSGAAGGVGAGA